jgi:hypothetical protein
MLGWLPESPHWLLKHGHDSEALNVLCRLEGTTHDDPDILRELDHIVKAIALEESQGFEWSKVFRPDPLHTGRRVLLAWGMQFMNQMGERLGINQVSPSQVHLTLVCLRRHQLGRLLRADVRFD